MTKKAKKVIGVMAMVMAVAAIGMMLLSPAPVKSAHKYSGTLYVAGMGGHFAVVDVNVNPADKQPIKISSISRIDIGESSTHPTHDPRIDNKDRNIMYWSTYKLDKSANNQLHVGKTDLKTGNVIADKTLALPPEAKWSGANYCGSGQSEKYYLPVSMAHEGYIDVIDKKTLELKERVMVSSFHKDKNYKFAHGINTPDGKGFFVIITKSPTPGPTKEGWSVTGEFAAYVLDMAALEKGEAKVVKSSVIKGGNPGKSTTFRMYYTPDGKYILQSAADMMLLIDGNTLELVAKENRQAGDNHDAIPTPDSKYAILTLRAPNPAISTEEKIIDGYVQLYDIEKKTVVGEPTSVCYACHKDEGYDGKSVLCGIDANWK
jgi:hypothetical protein